MPTSTITRNWIAGAALVVSVAAPLTEQTTTAHPSLVLSAATVVTLPTPPIAPQAPLVAAGGSGLRAREVAGGHEAGPVKARTVVRSTKKQKPASKVARVKAEAGSRSVVDEAAAGLPADEGAGSAAVKAVNFALDKLGLPYEWGGAGPDTYDCSGLTMRAYESAGIALPRTAAQQAQVGEPVAVDDLLPGDLLFYATDPTDLNTVHHVVMYLGDGQIIHAPHTGDVVRIGPMWLGDEYAGAVRIVPGERGPGVANVLAALARHAREADAKVKPPAARPAAESSRRPAASPSASPRPSNPGLRRPPRPYPRRRPRHRPRPVRRHRRFLRHLRLRRRL